LSYSLLIAILRKLPYSGRLPFITGSLAGLPVWKRSSSYEIASMSETRKRPWIVRAAVLCGLAAAIFLVGATIGYCRGAFGDGGSAERGFDWAIKTGILLLATSAIIGVLGGLGHLILSKLQLPEILRWAFLFGVAYAIMSGIMTGGGDFLGMNDNSPRMNDKSLWLEAIKGFLGGALVGAIVGLKLQSRLIQKYNPTAER
jgi:membrane associated rhomboid family serine protease